MTRLQLKDVMTKVKTPSDRLQLFASLARGVIESLEDGVLPVEDVVPYFFNGENCLFVAKTLADASADELMSRGVQLADVAELLPQSRVKTELRRELRVMRTLCLELLKRVRQAA